LILLIWGILVILFVGVPGVYYLYMRKFSMRPWNINRDRNFLPKVSLLIPAYNEEKTIQLKLENLMKLNYPVDKLQIIIVDDGSTDDTVKKVREFQRSNTDLSIEVWSDSQRRGKTASLNLALKKANGEIIVVSDADCFLSPNVLREALPFFADSSVGAVTGLEILLNPEDSWVTETEVLYNDAVHAQRVGESKVHSTILFQGGFGAYRRSVLDEFDAKADDSGTALNIVQKGTRTFLLPEAVYFTTFSSVWKGKIVTKLRRARQLVGIWFRCLKLFMRGELRLPAKIFVPEAFSYLVNPFLFIFIISASVLLVLENPLLLFVFSVLLVAGLLVKRVRVLLIEAVQNHLVLLFAIISYAFGKSFSTWSTVDVSRACLNRDVLKRKGLV
jgi:biofilm PGA synthesis N-glycosyltransferase PgaC